jgi:hypothetical protein
MKIIIDRSTKIFLRDYDESIKETSTEQVIEAPALNGQYKAVWGGESWEEGATQEYIDSLKAQPPEPTLEEKNRADIDYIAIMTGVWL